MSWRIMCEGVLSLRFGSSRLKQMVFFLIGSEGAHLRPSFRMREGKKLAEEKMTDNLFGLYVGSVPSEPGAASGTTELIQI